MTAWLSLAGAVVLVAAAVGWMQARSPRRRDDPADGGEWPPDQMAP